MLRDRLLFTDRIIDEVLNDIKSSELAEGFSEIRYPGERVIQTRRENLEKGIPVIPEKWETICAL